jgi:hypothetical protein
MMLVRATIIITVLGLCTIFYPMIRDYVVGWSTGAYGVLMQARPSTFRGRLRWIVIIVAAIIATLPGGVILACIFSDPWFLFLSLVSLIIFL